MGKSLLDEWNGNTGGAQNTSSGRTIKETGNTKIATDAGVPEQLRLQWWETRLQI